MSFDAEAQALDFGLPKGGEAVAPEQEFIAEPAAAADDADK